MSLATDTGHPQYAGTFIPEVWSTNLLVKFYRHTVFGAISNTDYEGEISGYGSKVYIRTVPSITIHDYVKGQDLQIETPESDNVELMIDKGKYFNFKVDDVDKYQSDLELMSLWSDDAGQQMKIQIDSDILADIPADADPANAGATAGAISGDIDLGATGAPVSLDTTNVVDYITYLMQVLDEQDVPETDRAVVLPAWACNRIKRSELKDASLAGDGTSTLRNGRVGMIDRATIYHSNSVSKVTDGTDSVYNIIACHKSALTFASQFTNMETIKSEKSFGDLVRGLNVFGYEVIKPEAMAHLYATPA